VRDMFFVCVSGSAKNPVASCAKQADDSQTNIEVSAPVYARVISYEIQERTFYYFIAVQVRRYR